MINKFLIVFFLISGSAISQQLSIKTAFLEKWKNSKEYLVKLAQEMPEERFGFKPTEREMEFKEQLLHIRQNMLWLSTTYFSEEKFDKKSLESNIPEKKTEIIAELSKAFDKVYDRINGINEKDLEIEVEFFAGPKSKLQILNLLQDHVTHHRGQLIVYLNLNDIKPPRYVGW